MIFEKAVKYAERVVKGKEITTKEVIIQCNWFLKDLEKQYEDDFDYYFDMEEIEKIEGLLELLNFATGLGVAGKTILEGLEGFQAFFLSIYSDGALKVIKKSLDTVILRCLFLVRMRRHSFVP